MHLLNMLRRVSCHCCSPSLLLFLLCLKYLKASLHCEGRRWQRLRIWWNESKVIQETFNLALSSASNYYEMLGKSLNLLGLNFFICKIRESVS